MNRVLVTGASGLIGSHVLRVLGRRVDVVAVSRTARADNDGLRWVACDLAEPGAIADVVSAVRPDVVIHLAGEVRGDRSLDAVGPTLRANLVATVELLEAAAREPDASASCSAARSSRSPPAPSPSPFRRRPTALRAGLQAATAACSTPCSTRPS